MISTGSVERLDRGLEGSEPIVGWRVWLLANNHRLCSISRHWFWTPGENHAGCVIRHGGDAPAPGCHCGFWALLNAVEAMRLAAQVEFLLSFGSQLNLPETRTVAVGLVHGYGTVSKHGFEGFRAEFARVLCIFSDAPMRPVAADPGRGLAAQEYGVPCIALDAAIAIGLLQEMGVGKDAVEQLEGWIASGRPLVQWR